MPKLVIDNREVDVPAGTSVLEAARQVGIVIPHFCYHPALGSVGACRLCAMKFLAGPVKGVQMSCMIPAQDGMVVSTGDAEAVRLRQLVIEWLMINHPHDCPVCDEGGECLLQDYTIAGGHGIRRYRGPKRTFLNQYLGPHIEHEMNRCIECYRCSRFYQEFAGGTDLGTMGSAGRVYFGRFREGVLESPFSGNLVDICPTGVYTDKTARYRARYWDYQMAPSICPHCSLGCNTFTVCRYRELLKTVARRKGSVNDWFICDRGRFTKDGVNDPERPRTPLVAGRQAGWDEALDALVVRLDEFLKLYGAGSLALVGSPRLCHEGALLLQRLGGVLDAGFVCHFTDSDEARGAVAAVTLLKEETAASMADVAAARVVVVAGTDLFLEGPMMALAVRQAWRRGAKVFATDSMHAEALAKGVSITVGTVASVAEALPGDGTPAVVIAAVAQAERLAAQVPAGAKLAFLFPGPNSCGGALLSRGGAISSLEEAVATGRVKGVLSFEATLPAELLTGLSLVIAADWLPGVVERADVFLPTTAWVEMDGTFINNEGRAQRFRKGMEPGLPVPQHLSASGHPPLAPRTSPPGGDVKPAWQVMAHLLARLGNPEAGDPATGPWAVLQDLDPEGDGVRVLPGGERVKNDGR